MDTNRLKKFASEARAILKRGVAAKILSLGFDDKGHIDEAVYDRHDQAHHQGERHFEIGP